MAKLKLNKFAITDGSGDIHSIDLSQLNQYSDKYQQIYVSSSGSDNNIGDKANPLKTFRGALKRSQQFSGTGVIINFLNQYTDELLEPVVISTPTLGELRIQKEKDNQQAVTLPPLYINNSVVLIKDIKLSSQHSAINVIQSNNNSTVVLEKINYETNINSKSIISCSDNSGVFLKSVQSTDIVGVGSIESFAKIDNNSLLIADTSTVFWFNGGCTKAVLEAHNSSYIKDGINLQQGNGIKNTSKCFIIDTYSNMTYGDGTNNKFITNTTDGDYDKPVTGGNGGTGGGDLVQPDGTIKPDKLPTPTPPTTDGDLDTAEPGVVKLSDAVDLDSDATKGVAATPLAVKKVNDKLIFLDSEPQDYEMNVLQIVKGLPTGSGAIISGNNYTVQDATNVNKGISKLSDSIDSDLDAASGTTASTPKAVKIAYTKAVEAKKRADDAYTLAQNGGTGGGSNNNFYIVTPMITSPTNDSTNTSTVLTITGTGYKSVFPDVSRKHRTFQISKQSDFSNLIINKELNEDSFKLESQLDSQSTYYIRIKDVAESMQSAWSNVIKITTGNSLKVDAPTIEISGEPNKIGIMPTITTSAFTIAGDTDTHKSTTWIIIDKSTNTEVYKLENDDQNKTRLVVPRNKLEWDKSYLIKVFYTGTTYGNSDITSKEFKTMIKPKEGDIGIAGQMGFGVGLAPIERADACDYELMPNGENPLHENYGNYQLKSNPKSKAVYIPPYWIEIGNPKSPRYSKYGRNCIDYKPYNEFSSESEANSQGYYMPEGFFNNGEIVGFFYDKYVCSEENGKYYSIEGANPVTNKEAQEMLTKCKRNDKHNGATIQQVQAIRFITQIQAQYCTNNTSCEWWDGNDIMNFPKGNNNNGSDVNDSSVRGTGNSTSTVLTGSCIPRAKTTHNGQKNGICDINGTVWQWHWGITSPSSGADYDIIFVKKRSVDFAKITFGLDGVTDAFGSETHLLTLYDKMRTGLNLTSTTSSRWGNGSNAVLRPYNSDGSHKLSAIFPKDMNSLSSNGNNQFGQDYFYKNNTNNLVPDCFGYWGNSSVAGVFGSDFSYYRTHSSTDIGVRSAAYGN